MAQIEIKNLSFSYPLSKNSALTDVNLSVNAGEFVVLCGKSGCGKTTFLRLIKNILAPKGKKQGEILLDNKDVALLSLEEQATKIGFVMQNPDNQIVTDKVWHELAFGLENLGIDDDIISIRIAEMASYFGIDDWFDKNVNELSGGQKQLLNLTCVMLMNPQVLLLDEPTCQLDPIAADGFLSTLSKINKEFGVTVIISEHRLEDVISKADRVVVMEEGKIISDCTSRELGKSFDKQPDFIKRSAPTPMTVFANANGKGECPLTVREGRNWLSNIQLKKRDFEYIPPFTNDKYAIELKNICFAYSKNGDDILKNLSLQIPLNSIFAVLGANGAGKSTLVKVISGIAKPYRGSVKINDKKIEKYKSNELYRNNIAVLPQAVEALFTASTVRLDLENVSKEGFGDICELTDITRILDSHPFDISGGEQQRAALAKTLLTHPKIFIADEPTKGMDIEFKEQFASILRSLQRNGCTVILISHDIEFCAEYADRCAMLFDGRIVSVKDSHSFFNENRFYTTIANKMSRGITNGVVTKEELLCCIKGK